MDDREFDERFEELAKGLDMPGDGVDELAENDELSDEEIADHVIGAVDNLHIDMLYITEIANRLQDEYDWTPEGAERIAQIYLERSLNRRDLQAGEGF